MQSETTIAMPKLMTPQELAAMTGLRVQTLAKMRCQGHGPAFVKLSHRAVRYKAADVAAWIDSNVVDRAAALEGGRR
jgi:predicted DNA-binding transcriptional regulator AlpA